MTAVTLEPPRVTWRHVWMAAALLVLVLFGAGADRDGYVSPDVESSVLQARELAGQRIMQYGDPWGAVMPDGDVVSNRFPGAVLVFVPVALLGGQLDDAGAIAAVVSTLGVVLLGLGLRRELGDRLALGAAGVLAFGTSVWSVAADALWPHTVTLLGIGLAAFGSGGLGPRWAVVLGDALALLARPHVAVIGAARGIADVLHVGFDRRRWLFWASVAGGTLGLAALAIYSRVLWDSWNPATMYATGEALGAATSCVAVNGSCDVPTLATLRDLLVSNTPAGRGLLVSSPFLLALVPGLRHGWRAAPGWVRGTALGGALYLAVSAYLHGSTGGSAFFAYRYPLETVAASTPLLAYAYTGLRTWTRRLFWTLVAGSIVWHALGALVASEGIV